MLRKDGLVRAREAAQSMIERLKEMQSMEDGIEEVKARMMIISSELESIKAESEDYQQNITDVTKRLRNSQEKTRKYLLEERKYQNRILQLETEKELFQALIQKHEAEKIHLEEQIAYLKLQLELDRAFLAHQTGIESVTTVPAKTEAETRFSYDSESGILRTLVDLVFDGHLHHHILSRLWNVSDPVPIDDLKLNEASEALFQRALMELKAREIIKLDEENKTAVMASMATSET